MRAMSATGADSAPPRPGGGTGIVTTDETGASGRSTSFRRTAWNATYTRAANTIESAAAKRKRFGGTASEETAKDGSADVISVGTAVEDVDRGADPERDEPRAQQPRPRADTDRQERDRDKQFVRAALAVHHV